MPNHTDPVRIDIRRLNEAELYNSQVLGNGSTMTTPTIKLHLGDVSIQYHELSTM